MKAKFRIAASSLIIAAILPLTAGAQVGYEFEYSSRINRFHRSYSTFTYYSPVFTDYYWYGYRPYDYYFPVYAGMGGGYTYYGGFSFGMAIGGISFGWYSPSYYYYAWDPFYYSYGYQPVVYNVRIKNHWRNYAYWHGGDRWYHGRPYYGNKGYYSYNTYNTYYTYNTYNNYYNRGSEGKSYESADRNRGNEYYSERASVSSQGRRVAAAEPGREAQISRSAEPRREAQISRSAEPRTEARVPVNTAGQVSRSAEPRREAQLSRSAEPRTEARMPVNSRDQSRANPAGGRDNAAMMAQARPDSKVKGADESRTERGRR